ncbi:hypothetical protein N0V84_012526 [Fusarium piperis]|uniref:non-specific serine/threonine protein kinase n=1 Tax=Fusarium piperis TaxID=1435070 RepID=A0A9W8T955_9HYPO|nr:hypothetical protein N0V84_012526 [Fusarium piperis]
MSPHSGPHPDAILSLRPINDNAWEVVQHQNNQHLRSYLGDGSTGLDIGHFSSYLGGGVLATLGRRGDILVEGASISKIQCSFEIDEITNAVMFYDRSHSQTSAVGGFNAYPFQHGRPRKVVVHPNFNSRIGMGGVGRDLVQFDLQWHKFPVQRDQTAIHPHFARTINDNDTVQPSQYGTRAYTLAPGELELRCFQESRIGSGGFGNVYRGVDVDSGLVVAVKVIDRTQHMDNETWWKMKSEVTLIRSVQHPHIIHYIDSRGWEGTTARIYMDLKDGSLTGLMLGPWALPPNQVADTALFQMLQAIDYLGTHGVVHRDIKPDNILYVYRESRFRFCLADFGLASQSTLATSTVGTPGFMAPECFQQGVRQTHQADVWSLFATILWIMDTRGFRQASASVTPTPGSCLEVQARASGLTGIWEMAIEDPNERASAAQMLVKRFNGLGLTTKPSCVPPLKPRTT